MTTRVISLLLVGLLLQGVFFEAEAQYYRGGFGPGFGAGFLGGALLGGGLFGGYGYGPFGGGFFPGLLVGSFIG